LKNMKDMTCVMVSAEEGVSIPTGNPFFLFPLSWTFVGGLVLVDTGLSIKLSFGFDLTLTSIIPGIAVVGMSTDSGNPFETRRISALLGGMEENDISRALFSRKESEPDMPFAMASVFNIEFSKVRFMEMGPNGGRIVTGNTTGEQRV